MNKLIIYMKKLQLPPHPMLETIYKHVDPVLKKTCIKENVASLSNTLISTKCDELLNEYLTLLNTHPNIENYILKSYDKYQIKRNRMHHDSVEKSFNQYKNVLQPHNDSKLWKMINWSGKINDSTSKVHPTVEDISDHAVTLYKPINNDCDISSLTSSIYIPVTDDPITMDEVMTTIRQIKKGGYYYPISVLYLLWSTIAFAFHLLNMFLNTYPSKLGISLLSLIPFNCNQ